MEILQEDTVLGTERWWGRGGTQNSQEEVK